MQYRLVCVSLLSLAVMFMRFTRYSTQLYLNNCHFNMIFLCLNTAQLISLFYCWWALTCFPVFARDKRQTFCESSSWSLCPACLSIGHRQSPRGDTCTKLRSQQWCQSTPDTWCPLPTWHYCQSWDCSFLPTWCISHGIFLWVFCLSSPLKKQRNLRKRHQGRRVGEALGASVRLEPSHGRSPSPANSHPGVPELLCIQSKPLFGAQL